MNTKPFSGISEGNVDRLEITWLPRSQEYLIEYHSPPKLTSLDVKESTKQIWCSSADVLLELTQNGIRIRGAIFAGETDPT